MIGTKLILLEGLPSTGKTTNSQFIQIQLERGGRKAEWIHEVSRPHPTLFFYEAGFTYSEYEDFLNAYPENADILNKLAVFRKSTVGIDLYETEWNYINRIGENAFRELRRSDVWSLPPDKYRKFALEKWACFTEKALDNKNAVYIMDSAVFQFQIFAFLLKNKPYKELESFVREIFDIIDPLKPGLIYLYRENAGAAIDYLVKERGAGCLEDMAKRDNKQPYYRGKPAGADGAKRFLTDYARFAGSLFAAVNCNKIAVEIVKKDWNRLENEILSFLETERFPDPGFIPPDGIYKNAESGFIIEADGFEIKDPAGKTRRLIAKTENEFYVERLPVVLRFEDPGRIIIAGSQISEKWTAAGLLYTKTG